MYNCDKNLVSITRPTKVTAYEPSTIDFLSLEFSERMVVDITIKKANNPPKVISISNGMFVNIKFVCDGCLYKATGKIQKITTTNKKTTPTMTRTFICPCHDGANAGYFIITLDCSDIFESRVFDIMSQDIRDLEIVDLSGNSNSNTNDDKCCDCCTCNRGDTSTDTPTEDNEDPDISGDIDITPDEDLETDPDFGTDPDYTEPEDTTTESGTTNEIITDSTVTE